MHNASIWCTVGVDAQHRTKSPSGELWMIVITFPAGLAECLEAKRGSTFTEVIVRTCSVSHPSRLPFYIYDSRQYLRLLFYTINLLQLLYYWVKVLWLALWLDHWLSLLLSWWSSFCWLLWSIGNINHRPWASMKVVHQICEFISSLLSFSIVLVLLMLCQSPSPCMQEAWCCWWASWSWLWLYKRRKFRNFHWKSSTIYSRGGCFRGAVWTNTLWGLWACDSPHER